MRRPAPVLVAAGIVVAGCTSAGTGKVPGPTSSAAPPSTTVEAEPGVDGVRDITSWFDASGDGVRLLEIGDRVSVDWRFVCDQNRVIETGAELSLGSEKHRIDIDGPSPVVFEVSGTHWGREFPTVLKCESQDTGELARADTFVTDGRPEPADAVFPELSGEGQRGASEVYGRDYERAVSEHVLPVCEFDVDDVDFCLPEGPLSGEEYAQIISVLLGARSGPWTEVVLGGLFFGACEVGASSRGEPCETVTMCNFMVDVGRWAYRVDGERPDITVAELFERMARYELDWPEDCDSPATVELLFEQWSRIVDVWGGVLSEPRRIEASALS